MNQGLEGPWFYQRESVKSLDCLEAQTLKVMSWLCHLSACDFGQITLTSLSLNFVFEKYHSLQF